jgi:hypothetical protein
MNLNTAPINQVIIFIKKFIKEKDLDKSDFIVESEHYGKTEMPFRVVKEALTTPKQNHDFIRQAAMAMSSLDFNNAPKEKFREFFQQVSNELIKVI